MLPFALPVLLLADGPEPCEAAPESRITGGDRLKWKTGAEAAADFVRRAGKVFPRIPRRPSEVTIERAGPDQFLLKWRGGNPPWQVQRTRSLPHGPWETITGPLTVDFCLVPLEGSAAFYRVTIAAPVTP